MLDELPNEARTAADQGDGPANTVTRGADPALMDKVVEGLKSVYDPEIPVNIWELGLVYRVDVDADRNVVVDMTLTAPSCPVAGEMPGQVQTVLEGIEDVKSVRVELVWDPPWHPGMMSEVAKVELDMF
jgi:FeS assembly SUF system protein